MQNNGSQARTEGSKPGEEVERGSGPREQNKGSQARTEGSKPGEEVERGSGPREQNKGSQARTEGSKPGEEVERGSGPREQNKGSQGETKNSKPGEKKEGGDSESSAKENPSSLPGFLSHQDLRKVSVSEAIIILKKAKQIFAFLSKNKVFLFTKIRYHPRLHKHKLNRLRPLSQR